jgi:F-type H+-transporting ATPase subunit c
MESVTDFLSNVRMGFMKRLWSYLATVFGGMFVSSLAFAEGEVASGSVNGLVAIGSCFAIGVAAFGAASAQGRATGQAVEGVARNPQSQEMVFKTLFLPLIFMEFQALMGFIIAILWYLKA